MISGKNTSTHGRIVLWRHAPRSDHTHAVPSQRWSITNLGTIVERRHTTNVMVAAVREAAKVPGPAPQQLNRSYACYFYCNDYQPFVVSGATGGGGALNMYRKLTEKMLTPADALPT